MKIFNCLNCNTEVTVDETTGRGRQKTKFCSKQCSKHYHNDLDKPKEKLFGKFYIERQILKTHKSIDDIVAELGIQPYQVNDRYVTDKKHIRFNQQQVDIIVQKFKDNKEISNNVLKINIQNISKNFDISWGLANKIASQNNFDIEKYTTFESCISDFKILIDEYNSSVSKTEGYWDFEEVLSFLNIKTDFLSTNKARIKNLLDKYGNPNGEITKRVGNTFKRLWPIEEIKIWEQNIQKIKQEKIKQKEEKIKEIQEKEELIKKELDGFITQKEALEILDKSPSPFISDRLKPFAKKVGERLFYNKLDIEQFKIVLDNEKEEKRKQSIANKNAKIIRRSTNWTDDLNYDNTKWQQIQKFGIPSGLKSQKDIDKWNNNYKLIEDRIQRNIIKTFICSNCNNELPYYNFNMDIKGGNYFGRYSQCRECTRKKRHKEPSAVQKKDKNDKQFLTQFSSAVRQDLSKKNNKYIDISAKETWHNLKKYCGYTKDDLIKHIESQFQPWMNWSNNKRPTTPDERTWQLDHVLPRSKFTYLSMNEPDFIQCWSLSNLKPIESVMNMIKSDVDLMRRCASSFRAGLNELDEDGFIWKHLPYTPAIARAELEKKYGDKIDWEKFKNSNLQIDHIVPQAYLSFSSFEDENFKKCWDLDNLQILIQNENASKGSIYEGKIWFHYKE